MPDDQERWWERGPVLADHKRQKKKLIPPMLAFPQMSFVSTLDQIFPELFWMCLVFQDVGPHRATRSIIPSLKALYEENDKAKWYRTSALLHQSTYVEERLHKAVDQQDACASVAVHLTTPTCLWMRDAARKYGEKRFGGGRCLCNRDGSELLG